MRNNRWIDKVVVAAALAAMTWSAALAGPPEITGVGNVQTLREMAAIRLSLIGRDPDGDAIAYSWTLIDNPIGDKIQLATAGQNSAVVSLNQGPSFPNPSYSGSIVRVRATVTAGGENAEHIFEVPVEGVNNAPVLDIRPNFSDSAPPLESGDYIAFDATRSYDPDGNAVPFLWQVEGIGLGRNGEGGQPISASLTVNGHYSDYATLAVPTMTAPMSIRFLLTVADGLHKEERRYQAFVQPATPDSPRRPPRISRLVASPSHAAYGQRVTLTATVSDDPGDTFSSSWLQQSTTGEPTVSLTTPNAVTTTFNAPDRAGTYRFRYTATDNTGLSANQTVSVQVSQQGGGGGTGGGGGGGGGGTSNPGIEGIAPGEIVCGDTGNSPAVATVPQKVTAEGGTTFQISALNGRDPDNTQNFVGGVLLTGVNYTWSLVNGGGVLTAGNLLSTSQATLSVSAPSVNSERTASVALMINDPAGCGTRYVVQLVIQPPATPDPPDEPNDAPIAALNYQMGSTPPIQVSGGSANINVVAPATVRLDATQSSDGDGSIATYSFVLNQQNIASGGVVLSNVSSGVRNLQVQAGTSGSAVVTVSVTDDDGAISNTIVLNFVISEQNLKPIPELTSFVGNRPLAAEEVVEEGTLVRLDASATRLEDGSNGAFLFAWRQLSGNPVSLVGDPNGPVLEFTAPAPKVGENLVFRLTVRNGSFDSEPMEIPINVDLAPIYHPQVAVGPLGAGQALRTVVVVSNHNPEAAQGVLFEFFDPSGEPLFLGEAAQDLLVNGQPWSGDPIDVPGDSAIVLVFSSQNLRQGWARIKSSSRLDSQVLYQIVDSEGGLLTEVPIFSGTPRTKFVAPFNKAEGYAIAVANPTENESSFVLEIKPPNKGSVKNLPTVVAPFQQKAFFINDSDFAAVPDSGSLVVTGGPGELIVTILKTTPEGKVFSTVPMPNRRQ